MPGYYTQFGYQFENLVLKNRISLFKLMKIDPTEIMGDNPYFQHETVRQKACQIDYLIQTRLNNLFVCEIKFSKNVIDVSVVEQVQEKIRRLKRPVSFSCFPILIHVNGVSDAVVDSGYFYKIISFGDLLKIPKY